MKISKRKLFTAILSLLASTISGFAQFENAGKLNVWTTGEIRRKQTGEEVSASLCKVRAAKNKDYDRLVFEFDAGKPEYIIGYLPSNVYSSDAGDERIKIAGRAFLQISIYGMGYSDEMPCRLENYPQGALKFPSLMQIDEGVWFEGIRDFLAGVTGKKPFRVQELNYPSRLVIDFKH